MVSASDEVQHSTALVIKTARGKIRTKRWVAKKPTFLAGVATVWGRFNAQNRRCVDIARCKTHAISTPILLHTPQLS
jgi:hypothetical protein